MTFVLKDVAFTYPSEPHPVFSDVNLTLNQGERYCLLGRSGVGKSTFLSLLGLLTRAGKLDGEITLERHGNEPVCLKSISQESAGSLRREHYGFALQNYYHLPHLTVLQNLTIPLGLLGYSEKERVRIGQELLEQMDDPDLPKDFAAKPIRDISGGQQQRVAVLRALIHRPQVVFADEPFSALDEENRDLILNMLKNWHMGGLAGQEDEKPRTLFLICHDKDVAAAFGTRSINLADGKVTLGAKMENPCGTIAG